MMAIFKKSNILINFSYICFVLSFPCRNFSFGPYQFLLSFLPLFTQIPKEVITCGEIEDKEFIKCRYAIQDQALKFIVAAFMSSVAYSIGYIEKNFDVLIEDL